MTEPASTTLATREGAPRQNVLAPPPTIDRYPIQIGVGLSLSYLASACRQAVSGFRQQFVDLLGELLENDPDAFAVFGKRILPVACARVDVKPAALPPGDPREGRAAEIASEVQSQLEALPMRVQAFAQLLWALYYGVAAGENQWAKVNGRWRIVRLSFVHSRRLSYPDPATWDLHIWDLGSIAPWAPQSSGTYQTMGLVCAAFPGKFVVHTPQVRADYPTREGVGRIVAPYLTIKRMVVRVSAQDFERFIKPWVIAWLNTAGSDGKPRSATDEDKLAAENATRALGAGSLQSAVLPDSVRIELLKAASTLNQEQFLAYLDSSVTKAALGQTFTMSPGKFGSKGTNDGGRKDTLMLARFDAACLADTLERDFVGPIVRLNYPGDEDLIPRLALNVDDAPDPLMFSQIVETAAGIGMPVDADANAQVMGVALLPKESAGPRGLTKADVPTNDAGPHHLPPDAEKDATDDGDGAESDLEDLAAE